MAERGRISFTKVVFWYMSPRVRQVKESVPHIAIFRYKWSHSSVVPQQLEREGIISVQVGDEEWAKAPNAMSKMKGDHD